MDPTGLDTSVTTAHTLTNVGAGSYSVSVMAVNENGASQAIMSATFVVESKFVSVNMAVYMCSVFSCLRTMSVCHCTCMTISYKGLQINLTWIHESVHTWNMSINRH